MAKDNKHNADKDHKDESLKDEDSAEKPSDGVQESRTEEHEEASEVSEEKPSVVHQHQGQHENPFKRVWHWALTHKKISIPAAAVVLLFLLAAVPFTRYLLAGTVVRQTFPVVVIDAESGKPVSSATVRLAGKEATTNGEGRAEIRTSVGNAKLEVTKKYYETSTHDVLIPIGKPNAAFEVKLNAKGRVVPVAVINSITKKPASNVNIKAAEEDTEAKTDDTGKATLVVPADKKEVKIVLSGEGYNNIEATIQVTTEEIDVNKLSITPSGKIYFLSNASGKIDLVKSNLDGTDRQTVLVGTGKEDRNGTWLNTSRDEKYLVLYSKRDGGEYPKLFLIETTNNDKITTMDEGEATFSAMGWSGDRFIYKVLRPKLLNWQGKRESIKSYHVPTKKITTLADSIAEKADYGNGYVYTHFGSVFIEDQAIIYAKNWGSSYDYWGNAKLKEKRATLQSIRADGSQSKTIKDYPTTYINVNYSGKPGELTVSYYQDNKTKYDTYKDGKVTFVPSYKEEDNPKYLLISPSGNKTAWRENRDGKNVFFVGDDKGENGKEIGRSSEFHLYGWATDKYILLTKEGHEMFIIPAEGLGGDLANALKVTDYYSPGYHH